MNGPISFSKVMPKTSTETQPVIVSVPPPTVERYFEASEEGRWSLSGLTVSSQEES